MTQIFKSDPNAKDVFDHKTRRLKPGDRLVIQDSSNGTRVPIFRHVRFIKYSPTPDLFIYVNDIGEERDAWLDDIDSIWLEPMTADEAEALANGICPKIGPMPFIACNTIAIMIFSRQTGKSKTRKPKTN